MPSKVAHERARLRAGDAQVQDAVRQGDGKIRGALALQVFEVVGVLYHAETIRNLSLSGD